MHTQGELLISFYRFFPEKEAKTSISLGLHVFIPLIDNWQVLTTFFLFHLQNWIAFTNLSVVNFTITDSLVFNNTNSPSDQDNYAVCQVRIIIATELAASLFVI